MTLLPAHAAMPLQDTALFSLFAGELDSIPGCFARGAEKALHNDRVRQQLRQFQKHRHRQTVRQSTPETEMTAIALAKLSIKNKMRRRPSQVSVHDRLRQLITPMYSLDWLSPIELERMANTLITELAVRYHQINTLSSPHFTPEKNRMVAMSILDYIDQLRDQVLFKCQLKKQRMLACAAFDADMNTERLCAYFRTEINRRIDTEALMRRAMSDTEGGKPVIENDYIKPSEQLRKELQEVRDAIEDVTHPVPTLNPPTLSLKHQAHVIRRSMQVGNSAPLAQSVGAPPGGLRRASRASTRFSIGRVPSTGAEAMRRNGGMVPPSAAPPEASETLHEKSGPRLWDLHSEEDIPKSIDAETLLDDEPPVPLTEITNDVIDLTALESVECDNPLLQGYTGSVSFSRRVGNPDQAIPVRIRYLPPCTYRKRHLSDYDYARLDAVPIPPSPPEHKIEHAALSKFHEVDDNMRSAPTLVSERTPKSFLSLASDPSTTVDSFDNESENNGIDEKLARFKEVEELYGEIMRTNKRVHLDPMETEEEESFACPAAPVDTQMLNSWLWQGLADPATLPAPAEKALAEAPRVISAGPFIRLRTRDAHSAYDETPALHPDDFIRNRSHAMARTLSSRYNGALRYNYGGYIPGDVDTKGTARIMSEPTVEDYTTFLRGRHTDFVFDLIYHEDELAEKRRKQQEEAERVRKIEEDMKRLEQERKERADQRRQMLSYERGEWNPKIMDFIAELHDASILASSITADEAAELGSARALSRQSVARLSVMRASTAAASSIPQTPQSPQAPAPPGTATPASLPTAEEEAPPAPVQPPRPISVDIRQMQQELEILWVTLKMPLDQKLDMAIKYGGHRFGPKLETAIRLWKTASQHIITREELLKEIEAFERTASNPERFFLKGPEGSSAARLSEAKDREDLMRRLHFVEARITDVITNIKLELKESVTYEGAPYKEKMKSDYTEMIKRLQRERLSAGAATASPMSVPSSRGVGALWQEE
ncbi:Coiled-coil domain-containing protein 87 [Geranomyces variabilis]|nr:Coiled-coil domain-containing protein 87 [Geranomyces variabilis]